MEEVYPVRMVHKNEKIEARNRLQNNKICDKRINHFIEKADADIYITRQFSRLFLRAIFVLKRILGTVKKIKNSNSAGNNIQHTK